MLEPPSRARAFELDPDLTPLLAARWSVREFDITRAVAAVDVRALVDAARTAPSAHNLQPWRLWITERGTEQFDLIVASLADYNAVWASRAALLIVGVARDVAPDGTPCPWADYDLGQATALLTVEATARGLGVCQMAGRDESALAAIVACAPGERVAIVSAVGYPGDERDLDPAATAIHERGRARRARDDAATVALSTGP
ncbi:nitroreductase [Microbacterium sp. SLBN-146]|nr:nitroreductase [Microbacterium sp. SLBN-146]